MVRLTQGATLLEQQMARRAAQASVKAAATAEDLLRQLLHEQRQANKMLWLTLTDEQRAQFAQMP